MVSKGLVADGRRLLRADHARRVADLLRRPIRSGAYDEQLPAEHALAREYAVSRNAIRDAFGLLRAEGLIERRPRVGTQVTGRMYEHGIGALRGLKETLRHGEVRNEVRAVQEVESPPEVARRLALSTGDRVFCIERLRFVDDLPASLDVTYLAPDLGSAMLERDLESNDVFALIEEICGLPLGTADLTVEAVIADPCTAATLQMPNGGGALLLLERLTRLADGRPVDLEYVRMRGDRIAMSGKLARPTKPDNEQGW